MDIAIIVLRTEDNAQLHSLFSEINDQSIKDAVVRLSNEAPTKAKRFVEPQRLSRSSTRE